MLGGGQEALIVKCGRNGAGRVVLFNVSRGRRWGWEMLRRFLLMGEHVGQG